MPRTGIEQNRMSRCAQQLGEVARTASGMECLLHSLLNVRPMPPELRKAWAAMFHHYVFDASDEDFSYLPPHRRGALRPRD